MMRNSVSKVLPLTIAALLAISGAVFAGDNAGAEFSVSPSSLGNIGPESEVAVVLTGDKLQGVKQYAVTLRVDPAGAFDLGATSFITSDNLSLEDRSIDNPGEWLSPGIITFNGTVEAGAGNVGDGVTGDDFVFGTFTLTTTADFETSEEADILITQISLGPSSTERDVFDADDLAALSVAINQFILGDVDNDTRVSVQDALLTLRIAVRNVDPTGTQVSAADIDGDGRVSVQDALRILRFVVRNVETLKP